MLAISLILVGFLLRLIPHAPNFTPVAAIALFSGAYLNRKYAVIVPLALMAASDIFIGLHNVILFTWGAFIISAFLGMFLRNNRNVLRVAGASLLSSFVFFVLTNFGVWVMGWYPQNLKGLLDCYVMALPFLRDFTVSTLIYSAFLFSAFEFIALFVKKTKLAKALL